MHALAFAPHVLERAELDRLAPQVALPIELLAQLLADEQAQSVGAPFFFHLDLRAPAAPSMYDRPVR